MDRCSTHEGSHAKESLSTTPSQGLPIRSYYSSHGRHELGEGSLYSVPVESIRARSLELGDLYLTTTMTLTQPSHDGSAQGDEGSAIGTIPEIGTGGDTTIPYPAVLPHATSHLSYQIKRHKDQTKDYQERLPLLDQAYAPSMTSLATSYMSIENPTHESGATHESMIPSSTGDTMKQRWLKRIITPVGYIPAVILGLLLNLLDAISYGMITFPLNNPIFASFGPEGISMFFVSCIVSQIVYSTGGSAFDGGNGSMMIEVVPFLHIMANKITESIGNEHPDRVITSTVVAFALSSVMTGIAFFLLGAFRLGSLIEFFPRHILLGTIGGVGWFLITTGIEVAGRLDENITYTIPMFRKVFMDPHTLLLWSTSLSVALLLRALQYRISHPLLVPIFFMALPLVFYLVIAIFRLGVNQVRDDGWIFPLVDSNIPFWHFYTYYDFALVDWSAVAKTLPAMIALTFFGVLHVPINVPALGVSTNKDDIDVNRELIAHGVSNALSGFVGSVQNYLVYTNSLLFIRSGGDSRLAGLMLAGVTTVLWMVGPGIVGYIPVMVVGSLIFHLGIDLLKEALYDTWNSMHYFEYATICGIVASMAVLGFVEGIFVGIIMACIFFVVQNARGSQAIRAMFTGQVLQSTVRRVHRQRKFLDRISPQIQVIKLQGYLFFGTIVQVERTIRDLLDKRAWNQNPIRFLILDMQLVQGLDFSAAEAFVRIRRLLGARQVYMIICSLRQDSDEGRALINAGMWDNGNHDDEQDLKCFETLNDALEWCENIMLQSFFARKPAHPLPMSNHQSADRETVINMWQATGSPRYRMLDRVVQDFFSGEAQEVGYHSNMTQPTLLLTQALGDISKEPLPVDFFHRIALYFETWECKQGEILWGERDPCTFLILVEHGSLVSQMRMNGRVVTVETILPGTMVGELGLFTSHSTRSRSVVVETDAVLWKLTHQSFDRMLAKEPTLANQFMILALYYPSERMDIMTRYAFQLIQR